MPFGLLDRLWLRLGAGLTARLSRRRDHTELLHETQIVELTPALDDLATGEAEDVDPGLRDGLAGWGNPLKVALVSPMHGQARDDLLPFGNHVFNAEPEVRKGRAERLKDVLDAGEARFLSWDRIMVDGVGGENVVQRCPVPRSDGGVKGLVNTPGEGFVLFDLCLGHGHNGTSLWNDTERFGHAQPRQAAW